MANEITISNSISVRKSTENVSFTPESKSMQIDMAGKRIATIPVTVGTAWEQVIAPSDFGTLGAVMILNKDATNFVEFGKWTGATGVEAISIGPARRSLNETKLTKAELALKADTASCEIEITLIEA